MDSTRLANDIKFASQIGVTLSLEERMRLELALLKLNSDDKYE